MSTKESPWKRMAEWDSTWKDHHYPSWLPRLAKAYLKTKPDHYYQHLGSHSAVLDLFLEFNGLFDHWGSRGPSKPSLKTLTTMPYCNCREKAELFAYELGLKLISKPDEPGAWFPSTFLFEFANPVNDP